MKTLWIISKWGCDRPFKDLFKIKTQSRESPMPDIGENDILLLEGGTDVNPKLYKEERNDLTGEPDLNRDLFEVAISRYFIRHGGGILGICRGSQLATVVSGGKLIQHVANHGQSHGVETHEGFKFKVTSTHHQMMNPNGVPHKLIAWSSPNRSDCYLNGANKQTKLPAEWKEPEIVWYPETRALAIQGHPEYISDLNDPFVSYCRNLCLTLF